MTRQRGTTGPVLGRYHVDGDVLYEVVLDCLATHRLTRLLNRDEFPPVKAVRDWVLDRYPIEGSRLDEGHWFPAEAPRADGAPARWTRDGVTVRAVAYETSTGESVVTVVADPHKWGVLVTCAWCASAWLALGVLGARRVAPRAWSPVARWLAYSSVVGWLSGHLG